MSRQAGVDSVPQSIVGRLGIRDCSGDVQRHGTGPSFSSSSPFSAVPGIFFRPGDVQGSALPGHVLPGDGECVQIELEKSLQAEEPVARIVDVAAGMGWLVVPSAQMSMVSGNVARFDMMATESDRNR